MGYHAMLPKQFGTVNKELGEPIAQNGRQAGGLGNVLNLPTVCFCWISAGYVARCIDVIGRDTGRVEMLLSR